MEPLTQLRQSLKDLGQSLTKPRQVVFMALQGKEPQTMQQVIAACPGIDRASVYRTVTLFEQLGIIRRLQIGWKYKLELSDAFSHHHHHLTCLQCGRIIPLAEDMELENRLQVLADAQNFAAQDHQIEIRGLCSSCQKT